MTDVWRHSDKRGNAYIEYLVLALVMLLATLFFFNGEDGTGGQFQEVEARLDASFDGLADKLLGTE